MAADTSAVAMTKSTGMHDGVLNCPWSPSDNVPSTLSQASGSGLFFLHLPAEIRNKIYQYALIKVSPFHINGLVQPPLTSTNRQVRSEALPVYYGNNRFQIMIPDKPLMGKDKLDEWAGFIRMFREFKAGRVAGCPSTGSLQFLRNLTCRQICTRSSESFLDLEVVFMQPATKPGKSTHRGCGAWEKRVIQKPKKPHLLKNREFAYKCVLRSLGDDETIMHETCVQRLIDTIVMVGTECPHILKEMHFHSDRNWEDDFPGLESD